MARTRKVVRPETQRKADPTVYKKIKDEQLLQRPSFWTTYELLYLHGPMTGSELNKKAEKTGFNLTAYHTCLNSLRKAGVVEVVDDVISPTTGGRCKLWDVTDKVPNSHVSWPPGGGQKRSRIRSRVHKRPDAEDILRAAQEFERQCKNAESRGRRRAPAVRKTLAWLCKGAPVIPLDMLNDLATEGAPQDAIENLKRWLRSS